jgi:hypothetical protein
MLLFFEINFDFFCFCSSVVIATVAEVVAILTDPIVLVVEAMAIPATEAA